MANINLAISFNHPSAVSNFVRYARIDNLDGNPPVFITVTPNPTVSPTVIASNIPDGQYLIQSTPIYSDGRTCTPTESTTPPCPGLITINAYISSTNIVVQYQAPSTVPKVRIAVLYPNGGSSVANYVNDGNNITIPLPSGVFGDFIVSGQSVCDEVSGFYSAPSSSVTVTLNPTTVRLTSTSAGISINTLTGISGFTLSQNLVPGLVLVGTHVGFTGPITATFTGTPLVSESASLYVNGTLIQCVNIPNTSGGTINFNSAAYAADSLIEIAFNTGIC